MDKSRANEWLKTINNLLYIYNQESGENKQIVDSKPVAIATKDYFNDIELQGFKYDYDPTLLKNLNLLRDRWGKSIMVSPVVGATGRHLGKESQSYHNIDYYGKVRAIDIFPGIKTKSDALTFAGMAKACGFNGIGVYLYWTPSIGFHLDNRLNSETWVDTAHIGHNYIYGDLETLLNNLGVK